MNFSTSKLVSEAWGIWKNHIIFTWLILGILLVASMFFSFLDPKGESAIISLFSLVVMFFLELGVIGLWLKLVRTGEEGKLAELFSKHQIFLRAFAANIVYGVLIVIGLICFIVPGIYIGIRFMFLNYLFVDQNLGFKEAFSESSRMTKGIKWDLFGYLIVILLLNILGVLFFFVGLFVSVPVTALATTLLYNTLREKPQPQEVAEEAPEEKPVVLPAEGQTVVV